MNDADSPKPGGQTPGNADNSSSGESRRDEEPTPAHLAPILHSLPASAQREVLDAFARDPKAFNLVLSVSSRLWRGPLPHPDDMRAFSEVAPDLPDRIMRMAELEQKHRHEVDHRNDKDRTRGQIFAFIITLVFVGVSVWLALAGRTGFAGVFLGATLLWLVSTFIHGRQKNPAMPPIRKDTPVE